MKARAINALLDGEPLKVDLRFDPAEAQQLADDLDRAVAVLDDGGVDDDKARVARLQLLSQVLRHELGHLQHASLDRQPTQPQLVAGVSLNAAVVPAAPDAFKGIPAEHLEWALKVYALTASHSRASEHAKLERVFEKGEAQAKAFFASTQNVWNMRVRSGEAPAYEVILGVQDARKHRKKGSFREVDRALCTGEVK